LALTVAPKVDIIPVDGAYQAVAGGALSRT
jgi:hypothetical protein